MTSKLISVLAAAAVTATIAASPSVVQAEESTRRKSALEGQPAVRHRILLIDKRFELSPQFETTINSDFKHTVAGGLKAEYHLSDMFSIGGLGFFGKSFNTGLSTRILDTLEDSYSEGDPTPTKTEFEQHLNQIPVHGAAYVTWTPWYGKLAAFNKAFVAFDFYFSGGLAFAQLTNDCCSFTTDPDPDGNLEADPPEFPDNDPNDDDPLNDGTQLGLFFGGGIHVFLNEWVALDLSFRDYWFQDNPSGLDFDANRRVDGDDDRFLNHFFAGIGISFFLPMQAERSE
jgi:outer membrane beta-barrel protein